MDRPRTTLLGALVALVLAAPVAMAAPDGDEERRLALTAIAESAPAGVGFETKRLIAPEDLPRLLEALGIAADDEDEAPQRRDIWFIDTPELALLEQDVILRARQEESDDEWETTTKLRGEQVDLDALAKLDEVDGFKREIDVSGIRPARSASLTRERDGRFDPADPLAGFDREQRRLARRFLDRKVEKVEGLEALGPIRSERWKLRRRELELAEALTVDDGKVSIERWTLADGSEIVEVSMGADDEEELLGRSAWLDRLIETTGIALAEEQGSKTRRALDAIIEARLAEEALARRRQHLRRKIRGLLDLLDRLGD